MKSVNIDLTKSFSTHHHLNPTILAKYRQVGWVFAIYRNIELACIHTMEPTQLEPIFSRWEKKWHDAGGKDINNPKIAVGFVIKNGKLVFGEVPDLHAPGEPVPQPGDVFEPEDGE